MLLSGISARALSYWEAGTHKPRLPELETVLQVIAATPQETQKALMLLDAPRSATRLQNLSTKDQMPIPWSGDLLRAMRHRSRKNLQDVADQMNVAVSSPSRWENGRMTPRLEQLEQLLTILEAHPEEKDVLLQPVWYGGIDLSSPEQQSLTLEAVWEQFEQFERTFPERLEDKSIDLRFLTFEAQIGRLANQSKTEAERSHAWQLLAGIYARYATYLEAFSRFSEVSDYASRAMRLFAHRPGKNLRLLQAVFSYTKGEVYRAAKPRPERGIRLSQEWEAYVEQTDEHAYEAWFRANEAEYLALAGQTTEALKRGTEACRIAENAKQGSEIETHLRRRDLARIYMHAGQVETALQLASFSDDDTPYWRTGVNLIWSEGLLRLGEYAAARGYLAQADLDNRTHKLVVFDSRISVIQAKLALM